ncbi:MAG: 30S ribosomal protein S11 [Candidatus Brennerbacteria bacterium]|nr:30S ribosomal protein S11 [Candidatus Brennerbacteria bacterium]
MGKKKIATTTENAALPEKEKQGTAAAKAPVSASKKIEAGRVYINASYNNTMVTVAGKNGEVLAWASSGSLGFSGPKKATPFASTKVIEAITEKIQRSGPFNVDVIVKGVGSGRDSAVRALINRGFNILSIKDVTPIPHNGPRPPKVRRV